MREIGLGDRELDVMGVLWELGSGTVTEVRDKLRADLAYTTVLTILRNLEEKGVVKHEAEGRAHRYSPAIARESARRRGVARLLDKLFHGSAEQLIAHLVEGEALTPAELQRIRKQLASRRPSAERKGKR